MIGVVLQSEPRAGRPPLMAQHRSYLAALEAAGALPLAVAPLPDDGRLRQFHERCDALLLPGGPDVSPPAYGQEAEPGCGVSADGDLDRAELRLLGWALEEDRPVLGICRGLQLLNVARGGTLWQDLDRQHPTAVRHRQPDAGERFELHHGLELEPGSRLHGILGATRIEVNSFHHQGIRDLGDGLVAIGRSDDGLIEAVEAPDRRYAIAVQAHPEDLCGTMEWARLLFSSFVEAAAGSGAA